MKEVPIPQYIDLKRWADYVTGAFEEDFLPVLTSEQNWLNWGRVVAGSDSFLALNVPSPESVTSKKDQANPEAWRAWAQIVYQKISENN